MLQEEISRFKTIVSLLLPELIQNGYADKPTIYEEYAILSYDVQDPVPLDDVMDMLEDNAGLAILYQHVPSDATLFGHSVCAFPNPSLGLMYKLNAATDDSGCVDRVTVTVFDSLEQMHSELMSDLMLHSDRGRFVIHMDEAELYNLFSF